MSDPTTPEPHPALVATELENLLRRADLYQSVGDSEYGWWTRAYGAAILATIERLEGEKDELEATVVRAAHEVDDHIAALLDARGEVERLRGDLRDALDVAGVRRCLNCGRLGLREPYCCGYCGNDPSEQNEGAAT